MDAVLRPHHAAAPRLRRHGPGAQLLPPRALPADDGLQRGQAGRGGRQLPGGQPHHERAVLPPAPAADAEDVAEAPSGRSPEDNAPHVRGSVQPRGHGAVHHVPPGHR